MGKNRHRASLSTSSGQIIVIMLHDGPEEVLLMGRQSPAPPRTTAERRLWDSGSAYFQTASVMLPAVKMLSAFKTRPVQLQAVSKLGQHSAVHWRVSPAGQKALFQETNVVQDCFLVPETSDWQKPVDFSVSKLVTHGCGSRLTHRLTGSH